MIATPSFYVRDLPVHGEVILAPMDGYSDRPFRSVCRALGSAMSYTEFVKAEHVLRNIRRVRARLAFEADERPVVFQLYGDDAHELREAALRVQELGPDVIDINMGCPARSVVHGGCGVGLMRTPHRVAEIFTALSQALEIPVTGKMRLGWDDCLSYREVARAVEDHGGALIAVHARTKDQGYGGQANWDAIAEVKALVRIPVIGNGDVRTVADIARMKQHTGCDAVMIGRAAIGNPWIFAGLDRGEVTPAQVRATMHMHLERSIRFYGEEDGTRLFRKHAVQYLGLRSLDREARKRILQKHPAGEFASLLDRLQEQLSGPA